MIRNSASMESIDVNLDTSQSNLNFVELCKNRSLPNSRKKRCGFLGSLFILWLFLSPCQCFTNLKNFEKCKIPFLTTKFNHELELQ